MLKKYWLQITREFGWVEIFLFVCTQILCNGTSGTSQDQEEIQQFSHKHF